MTRAPTSFVHLQLRERTSELHRGIERQLNLLEPGLPLDRYRRKLELLYGLYDPLEARLAALWPLPAALPPLGVPLRARAAWLARDLLALGATPSEVAALPRCADLPGISDPDRCAGCLYVLEGASLGGRVIARAVERGLGLDATSGAAFFVGDGEETGPRWRQVLAWLGALADAGAATERIVVAACETFEAFTRWVPSR